MVLSEDMAQLASGAVMVLVEEKARHKRLREAVAAALGDLDREGYGDHPAVRRLRDALWPAARPAPAKEPSR